MNKQNNWEEIGEQSKAARAELFKLIKVSEGLPLNYINIIIRSIRDLDDFRCDAEERMFKEDSSKSTKVFYGERRGERK